MWHIPVSVAAIISVPAANEVEISVNVSQAEGEALLIWLPSEHGPQSTEADIVKGLVKAGIEVWQVDLFEANFLPISFSSMAKIPDDQIGALINAARKRTGKSVFIATSGRGVIPVLRGARRWQQQTEDNAALKGLILLTPKFFVETPEPGQEGKLMPIVRASNLPIYILQPDLSPWFWKLPVSVPALQQGGSEVFIQRLRNVRGRFYFRPDASDFEQQFSKTLPDLIRQAAWYLSTLLETSRQAVADVESAPVQSGRKDRALTEYTADPNPPALILPDLAGQSVDLQALRGEVLLVNFWASWCPPCVHEMPSMARLVDHFEGQSFRILAVNMAEDPATIRQFTKQKVRVNYPILLDRDGRALRDWRVFAFPTSYVIDRKGQIRYAVFGSIEWDGAEIIHKLEKLIKE